MADGEQEEQQQEEQQHEQQEERQEEQRPDPAEEVTRLREENARLQGELSARRETPPAPPQPRTRSLATMTLAELDAEAESLSPDDLRAAIKAVETKVDAGEIAAGSGSRLLGRLEAVRLDRERQAREAVNAPIREAEQQLAERMTKYPDLRTKGSELLGKVSAELPAVCRMTGFAPEDPRAHLLAVDRVVGGHRMGGSNDLTRRRIPTGGAGGGPGGDDDRGTKKDPVKEVERLYPDQVAFWDRLGYSADERKAEAPIVLARRARRAARTA